MLAGNSHISGGYGLHDQLALQELGVGEFCHKDFSFLQRSQQTKTILYAEDCPISNTLLGHMLENVGFEALSVFDGLSCITEYERLSGCGRTVDAILLDVGMPRLDGIKTCQSLRDAGFDGPIVVMTGMWFASDRATCRSVGADHYIPKEFIRTSLGLVLGKHL